MLQVFHGIANTSKDKIAENVSDAANPDERDHVVVGGDNEYENVTFYQKNLQQSFYWCLLYRHHNFCSF